MWFPELLGPNWERDCFGGKYFVEMQRRILHEIKNSDTNPFF
jgi:hypothetical protein